MPKVSSKENKNAYFKRREELGLTRDQASERLATLTPERIDKIENERSLPHPEEVLEMSQGYQSPELCNYYCATQCPIGRQYVPEVRVKGLPEIVLQMLASLNEAQDMQKRLIEITQDGSVEESELGDFVHIQETLEQISIAVEGLQLWSEQMLAKGVIDREQYEKLREQASSPK